MFEKKLNDTLTLRPLSLYLAILIWVTSFPLLAAPAGYSVYWSDEFNGTVGTAPSSANWAYDTGATGWGNGELENYTSNTANAQIVADANATDGKSLAIITLDPGGNNDTVGSYTSARIRSQGLQSFQYGYIEARVRMPFGQGIWPAFWMLGNNISTVPWPGCGEMDIMENIGKASEQALNHGSMHGPGYSGGSALTGIYTLPTGQFNTGYHTFGILWQANQVQFYVDGNLYETHTPADIGTNSWVFNNPFFFILNTAVGGSTSWPGQPDSTTSFPQTMLVDYVRVYHQDTATPTFTATPSPTATRTATVSPTPSPTASFTPVQTPTSIVTPPCGTVNLFGNSSIANTAGGASSYNPGERASVFPLVGGGTVYSLALYAQASDAGYQVVAGVFSGVPGVIGGLIVQSAPQTLVSGWNVIPVQPTYLGANYYWLAYMFNGSGYHVTAQTAAANDGVYTTSTVPFGSFASAFTSPVSYISVSDAIYANYCPATATVTYSPTITLTPTVTLSPTATQTPTFTRTTTPSFTPTPSLTQTPSATSTVTPSSTATRTSTATPTVTLTPSSTNTLTLTMSPTSSQTSAGTFTLTATFTPSTTATPSPVMTLTMTSTKTDTATASATITPSMTLSPTETAPIPSTPTRTPVGSPSFTQTSTPSATSTAPVVSLSPTLTPISTGFSAPILYPNPVRGNGPIQLRVQWGGPQVDVAVKIYTTAFRKIYETEDKNVPAGVYTKDLTGFHVSDVANGLYYVVITTPTNRWIDKLLILH